MRPRYGILVGLTTYGLVWAGCHRAEIDLNDLLPRAGEAGAPDDAGAGGQNRAGAPGEGGAGGDAPGGTAGAAVETAGASGSRESGEPQDSDPPRVLSITPSDGERGVRHDVEMVVRFSEPMDREATALSVALGGIALGSEWNEAATELSLTPLQPLEYAMGTDPELVQAIAYSLIVNRSATDVAGNALERDHGATFHTARQLATRLPGNDALIGYAIDSDNPFDSTGFTDPHVGDSMDRAMKGFVTFELSALPPETEDVERAILTVNQYRVTGDPFQMGSMLLDHVRFTSVGLVLAAPTETAFGSLFADAATKTASIDVTSALRAEIAEGPGPAGHLQFRFGFATAANLNGATDEVRLRPLRLEVSYVVP